MHDVLAHRISLLSMHAGALEFRPDAPAAEIAEAAGIIWESASLALEDLREVIGVLRQDRNCDASQRPQPTLIDLPALVEESRQAGTRSVPTTASPTRRRSRSPSDATPTAASKRDAPTPASTPPVPGSRSSWTEVPATDSPSKSTAARRSARHDRRPSRAEGPV